ncbi:MAG: tetratricopeptide repeat protein [Pseudomonadales bacterium]|nr:tetratricopeptide repeat protein [Pseudomonadales bacterium]
MLARLLLIVIGFFLPCIALQAALQLPNSEKIQAEMDLLVDTSVLPAQKLLNKADKAVRRGVKSHDKGKYLKAISYFDKAIDLSPLNSIAYYEKANSQAALNQLAEAYSNVVRALVLAPGMEAAHVMKASLLDDSGDAGGAIIAWDKLLLIHPESFMAWLNKGITHLKIKDYRVAENAFRQATRLEAEHPSPYYFLFVSSAMQDFHYDEIKYIGQYLEVAGQDSRRSIVEQRHKELTANTVYVNPKAEYPELEMLKQTLRMIWFTTLHRETYPDERGYKRSLKEECYVAEKLISFWILHRQDLGDIEYLAELKAMQDNNYLEAYFYLQLVDVIGDVDLAWGQENQALITAFEAWNNIRQQHTADN